MFETSPQIAYRPLSAPGSDAEHFAAIVAAQNEIATAQLDLEPLLTLIATRTQALTQADGAAIELLEGEEMVYRAATGQTAPFVGLRLNVHTSLSGKCTLTREVLSCGDSETDTRVDRQACRRIGVRSMIVVPLPASSQIVGVLKVLSSVPDAFGPRDIQTLQMMAGLLGAMVNHAARLQEQSEALRQSESRYRTIVDTMREGIWMTDAQYRTTFVNQRMTEMMGCGVEEMLCRPISDFIFEEDGAAMNQRFAQRRQGKAGHFDARLRRGDGTTLWALVSSNALCDNSGAFCGALALLSDITGRKQAEAEREATLRQIEGLNSRLKRGMSETHHRVKNNLQVIVAMIDMQMMEHREGGTIPLAEMQRLGMHISALAHVHDILTRHLKETESEQRISARTVLLRLLPLLQQTATSRRIRPTLAPLVLTGKQCMAIALATNELVINALRHGVGTVEVHLEVPTPAKEATSGLPLQAHVPTARLVVTDEGPGFPLNFDAQLCGSTGLQLVSGVVAADLGGTLAFQNRPQGGATVTVTFPLPPDAASVT